MIEMWCLHPCEKYTEVARSGFVYYTYTTMSVFEVNLFPNRFKKALRERL